MFAAETIKVLRAVKGAHMKRVNRDTIFYVDETDDIFTEFDEGIEWVRFDGLDADATFVSAWRDGARICRVIEIDGRLYQLVGQYSSWDTDDWSYPAVSEVRAIERTVTRYVSLT